MKTYMGNMKKQAGFTLMEILVVIAVGTVLLLGGLGLSAIATSSTSSVGLMRDLTTIRTSTQSLSSGQGGYGTASLNAALITASKIPSGMTTATPVINTSLGGTLTITGNTNNFTMALTNVPADICSALLTGLSSAYSSVRVGSSAAITTFPVSLATATAAANCGGTAPFTITWTTIN